jgi:hypothetical protein
MRRKAATGRFMPVSGTIARLAVAAIHGDTGEAGY